ncbi:hypothetical protein ECC02_000885 [Trypanosoma cruzi]|uniref:Protein kinase domain-containing protein n=1 Tax=Trypanosoma cruzi TaxID=5693 RepID=A0A7J6YHT3_TRYCR|nr:hypothetical protein ECC02_000885 [Trypanosoma cruzi]
MTGCMFACDMDAFSFFARSEEKGGTECMSKGSYRSPLVLASGVGKCGMIYPDSECLIADAFQFCDKPGKQAEVMNAGECGQINTGGEMILKPWANLQELIPPPTVRLSRQLLGRGRQAAVWLCEDTRRSGVYYAVKTIEMPFSTSIPVHQIVKMLNRAPDSRMNLPYTTSPQKIVMEVGLEEEARLMQGLRHSGLVQLHGVETEIGNEGIAVCRLYLEYMSCGSLLSFVRQHYEAGRLRERALRWFLKPIVEGLCYMHANDVVHMDVKAENILVKWADEHEDECGDCINSPRRFPVTKLGDFGCARYIGRKASTHSSNTNNRNRYNTRALAQRYGEMPSGTPGFMAPEVVLQPHTTSDACSPAADIWSLGCTILQLLYGALPVHSDLNVAAILFETAMHPEKIHRFIPSARIESDTSSVMKSMPLTKCREDVVISMTLRHLLLQCLQPDASKRATAAQLLQHPFFQQHCNSADAAEGLLDPHLFDVYSSQCGLQNESFLCGTSGSLISTHIDGLSISDWSDDEDDDTDDDMMIDR